MRQNEKLKLVFDFIADYLGNENNDVDEVSEPTTKEIITESDVVTTNEDSVSRAYEIMKRLEKRDVNKYAEKADVRIKTANDEANALRAENALLKMRQCKCDETNVGTNDSGIVEKLGLTIGPDGKVVSVSVKPLTEERGEIEAIIREIDS